MSKIIKHIFDIYKNDINTKKYLWDNLFKCTPNYLKFYLYKLMLEHNVGSLDYVVDDINIIKLYIEHYIKSRRLSYYEGVEYEIINLAKKDINIKSDYFDYKSYYKSLLNNRINYFLEIYSQNNNLNNVKLLYTNNLKTIEDDYNRLIINYNTNYYYGIKECKNDNNKLLDIDDLMNHNNEYLFWLYISKKPNINLSLFRYYVENVYDKQELYIEQYNEHEHTKFCRCKKFHKSDEETLLLQKNEIIHNFLENETIINSLLLQSKHTNLLWNIIKSNPHINWSYYHLSSHPCINWTIIIENPELPWSYENLCNNPNMTLDNINLFIKFNNIQINKDNKPRELFAQNINLTSDEINEFLDKEKSLIYKKYYFLKDDPLALNPNITFDIVKKYGSPNIAENYNTLIQNRFLDNNIFNKEYYKIIQTQKRLNIFEDELYCATTLL